MLQADALRLQTSAELSRQWSNKDGRNFFRETVPVLSKWANSYAVFAWLVSQPASSTVISY